jgi:hypothetical protein
VGRVDERQERLARSTQPVRIACLRDSKPHAGRGGAGEGIDIVGRGGCAPSLTGPGMSGLPTTCPTCLLGHRAVFGWGGQRHTATNRQAEQSSPPGLTTNNGRACAQAASASCASYRSDSI